MDDGGTSVQLSGAFHLICGAPASRGGIAATCGDLASVWALQTAATHLIKTPFCASVRSALPRILKNSVESAVLSIAATILPSLAGSAFFGSPAMSTTMMLPKEVRSRCAVYPSFSPVIGG